MLERLLGHGPAPEGDLVDGRELTQKGWDGIAEKTDSRKIPDRFLSNAKPLAIVANLSPIAAVGGAANFQRVGRFLLHPHDPPAAPHP